MEKLFMFLVLCLLVLLLGYLFVIDFPHKSQLMEQRRKLCHPYTLEAWYENSEGKFVVCGNTEIRELPKEGNSSKD